MYIPIQRQLIEKLAPNEKQKKESKSYILMSCLMNVFQKRNVDAFLSSFKSYVLSKNDTI